MISTKILCYSYVLNISRKNNPSKSEGVFFPFHLYLYLSVILLDACPLVVLDLFLNIHSTNRTNGYINICVRS